MLHYKGKYIEKTGLLKRSQKNTLQIAWSHYAS